MVAQTHYLPYGQERWNNGATPTDFTFTAQRSEASFGLMDYNARYYSPVLGRFISPDSIVPEPGSSGGFNRYRYARNNPVRYSDPTGHFIFEDEPDDPEIWRRDKPDDLQETLVRGEYGSFVMWEKTRMPDVYPNERQNYNPGKRDQLVYNISQLSYPDKLRGTASIGYGGNAFAAIGIRGGTAVNFDTYGNVSITGGGGGGGYASAGGSLGWNFMVTNAPTVDILDEYSVQLGGSVAKLVAIGGEWVIFSDEQTIYHGINISPVGPGDYEPWPLEVHGTVEHDWTIIQFNIFELVQSYNNRER